MNGISVVLAEDHTLVRAGIRSLLEAIPGVEVLAEASDGREAIGAVRQTQPDLVLTDIAMAGMNGLEATRRIKKEHPRTRVLVLSMYANEEYVVQALRAGADGYLVKDAATSELEIAIATVGRGERYLSPAVDKPPLHALLENLGELKFPIDRLTPRQREILQLVAEGNSTRKIAELLSVSVKTVETHRSQLMERLNIFDVASLVRYAIRAGLISPES